MAQSSTSVDLFVCPRCAAALLAGAESWRCGSCGTQFPLISGIPWLLPEPAASMGEWRQRLQFLLQHLEAEAARVRGELDKPDLLVQTRSRLKLLAHAYRDQARRLQALLAPLAGSATGPIELHAALRTRLPPGQGLTSYYANIHRDWVWGEEENQAAFAQVRAALAEHAPGRLLILGAGACRLAYDVHRSCAPEVTIAADINPLLLLVAAAVLNGDGVSLYEFPLAPRSAEESAVLRSLRASESVGANFHLVFADAMRAPFATGSFDTIITPWLIDIIPDDFVHFTARLNRLLRPGGVWVNSGSLAFAQPESARCYSLEEVLEITAAAGFVRTYCQEATLPYMRSPASRHGRLESVVTFAVRKERATAAPTTFESLPSWLIDAAQPVPLLPAFRSTALSTRIYAFIMSLIDGQRSLRDMASALVQQRLMSPEDAEPTLRGFLIKMYEESQQRRDF